MSHMKQFFFSTSLSAFLCSLVLSNVHAQTGCTDALACNFDAAALTDDGSCNYLSDSTVPTGPGNIWHVGVFLTGTVYEPLAGPCEANGSVNPNLSIQGILVGDGSAPLSMVDIEDPTGLLTELAGLASTVGFGICGSDITVNALGEVFAMVQQGDLYVSPIPVGPNGEYLWAALQQSFDIGCADPTAANYTGTCDVSMECTYNVAFRVNMANVDVSADGVHLAGSFNGWSAMSIPMIPLSYDVYEVILELVPGYYEYKFVNGNVLSAGEYTPYACAAEFTTNRMLEFYGGVVDLGVPCFGSCTACSGCSNPLYLEFDPFAAGTLAACQTDIIPGCTDASAANFNPAANADNGTCEGSGSGNACPGDFDDDGAVTSSDLLSFLALFGVICY